ncbi:penicillin-binding protein 1C, partial [Leclercia pneumoniae]|nr:penicillin-binding protein 1C [Leclercia pneumoniae]
EPWLPGTERRAERIPPSSTQCPPLSQDDPVPLILSGIQEGAVVKRLPGEPRVSLPLQVSGSTGQRWWFLNGEPLNAQGRTYTLKLEQAGEYQLLVMDEAGQVATVHFTLQ